MQSFVFIIWIHCEQLNKNSNFHYIFTLFLRTEKFGNSDLYKILAGA